MAIIATIDDSSNSYLLGTQRNGRVFIKLLDDVTRQPVNGNYITVKYQQNQNGVITEYTVSISGQSVPIYTGLLSDSDPAHPFYLSFFIISVGPPPQVIDPPVNTCDLQITSVNIDRSESAPGAADGQATVVASSSYLPIEYSLDGVTFQPSPVFSTLVSGLHTFTARDANGCQAVYPVTVTGLNNLLLADPSMTITGNNISRWNAAFNPVVFTYQRKDFSVTVKQNPSSLGMAIAVVNRDISSLKNDDSVYLAAGNYKGIFKFKAILDNFTLDLGLPYTSDATGFININQLRPYYRVITQISYFDKLTGQLSTIKSTNRPDGKGITRADLSNFLQSLLRPVDESNYTQYNFRDTNLCASYRISYAEAWDDSGKENRSDYVNIDKTFYVVYAAKQLGERYGGNLAAYVPFINLPAGEDKAKWITDFAEPAFNNGYPFDIGFIYSEDLLGYNIFCEMVQLDINRRPFPGGPQTSYLLNDDGSWLLNQDGSKLVIARQSQSATPVPAQLGLNRLLINNVFADDVYFLNITLKYTDGNGNTHPVTQTQTIRVDDAVDDQSVYLRWIGLSGSWNYYRFVYNQEVSLDVQNAVIVKNYVYDWENQQGIEEVISKSAGQKVKVTAEDLSIADIKGLQSIKYSPKVQMLVNKNPVKWQTIVINTATYSEYETRNGQAPFSITFNLPAVNVQMQ